MTVEESIEYYLQRKADSELSISEIRSELKAQGEFTDDDISKICRGVSDREMSELNKVKINAAAVLNHPFMAYILAGLFAYLIYFSFIQVVEMSEGTPRKYKIWRYALLIGAVFFFLRNIVRIINYNKRK